MRYWVWGLPLLWFSRWQSVRAFEIVSPEEYRTTETPSVLFWNFGPKEGLKDVEYTHSIIFLCAHWIMAIFSVIAFPVCLWLGPQRRNTDTITEIGCVTPKRMAALILLIFAATNITCVAQWDYNGPRPSTLNETAYYVDVDRVCDLAEEDMYRGKIIITSEMNTNLPCDFGELVASLNKANVVAHIWLTLPFNKGSPTFRTLIQTSWNRNKWRGDGKLQIIHVNVKSIDAHSLEDLTQSEHQALHVVVRPRRNNEYGHLCQSPSWFFSFRMAAPVLSLIVAMKAGSSAVERSYDRKFLRCDLPFAVLSLECVSATLFFIACVFGQWGEMQAPYWFLNWLTGNNADVIKLTTTALTGILIHRLADSVSVTGTTNLSIPEGWSQKTSAVVIAVVTCGLSMVTQVINYFFQWYTTYDFGRIVFSTLLLFARIAVAAMFWKKSALFRQRIRTYVQHAGAQRDHRDKFARLIFWLSMMTFFIILDCLKTAFHIYAFALQKWASPWALFLHMVLRAIGHIGIGWAQVQTLSRPWRWPKGREITHIMRGLLRRILPSYVYASVQIQSSSNSEPGVELCVPLPKRDRHIDRSLSSFPDETAVSRNPPSIDEDRALLPASDQPYDDSRCIQSIVKLDEQLAPRNFQNQSMDQLRTAAIVMDQSNGPAHDDSPKRPPSIVKLNARLAPRDLGGITVQTLNGFRANPEWVRFLNSGSNAMSTTTTAEGCSGESPGPS